MKKYGKILIINVLCLLFLNACMNNNFKKLDETRSFEIVCNKNRVMEGDTIEIKISYPKYKNLLLLKPNGQFTYLQNKSIDSLLLPQKEFEKATELLLDTRLKDTMVYNGRTLLTRVFHIDGKYKIIFTNASLIDNLEENYHFCEIDFMMWK